MALWRSGSLVAALLLLGRFTGFSREWVLSARAGASAESDLAIVLLTLPDLLVNLLLGGGLGATLVPVLQQLNSAHRQRLTLQVTLLVAVVFAAVALLLGLASPSLLALLAPGVPLADRLSAAGPLNLALIALPLTAVAGVSAAFLNASGRFGLGACGTALFNLVVIAALVMRLPLVWAVAAGVVGGALLRLLVQALGAGWRLRELGSSPWLLNQTLLRRFVGNFGFVTALVLLAPIARAAASTVDPGALSLFNYASKLVDLPMGVLMGSLSTVLLPHLAANPSGLTIWRVTRFTLVSTLAISLTACVLATPLVQLVYFRADFQPAQIQQLGQATALAFAFLLPQAMVSLFGTVFAALGRTRPLLIAGAMMALLLLALAPVAAHLAGLRGVMLSYGGSYLAGACLLGWSLRRQLELASSS